MAFRKIFGYYGSHASPKLRKVGHFDRPMAVQRHRHDCGRAATIALRGHLLGSRGTNALSYGKTHTESNFRTRGKLFTVPGFLILLNIDRQVDDFLRLV